MSAGLSDHGSGLGWEEASYDPANALGMTRLTMSVGLSDHGSGLGWDEASDGPWTALGVAEKATQ
jgi:hypothetical protein